MKPLRDSLWTCRLISSRNVNVRFARPRIRWWTYRWFIFACPKKTEKRFPGKSFSVVLYTAVGGPIFAFAGSSRGEIIAGSHKIERRNRRNVWFFSLFLIKRIWQVYAGWYSKGMDRNEGRIAQLVRAPRWHRGGHRFEFYYAHHTLP